MLTRTQPDDAHLTRLADRLAERPLSYEPGLLERLATTRHTHRITRGWFVDRHAEVVGHGADDFAAAEIAVREWAMFAQGWTVPVHPSVPIKAGHVVTYGARVLGLWWSYGCRILDVIDESDRFGFVYGTIAGHAESGEERFLIELLDNDDVVFSLYAASRPGRWFAWPGLVVARCAQHRFRAGATASIRRAISHRSDKASRTRRGELEWSLDLQ